MSVPKEDGWYWARLNTDCEFTPHRIKDGRISRWIGHDDAASAPKFEWGARIDEPSAAQSAPSGLPSIEVAERDADITRAVDAAYREMLAESPAAPRGLAKPLLDVLRELTPQQAADLAEMLDNDKSQNAALVREAIGNAEHRYYVSGEGWVDSLRIVELAEEIQRAAPSGLDPNEPPPGWRWCEPRGRDVYSDVQRMTPPTDTDWNAALADARRLDNDAIGALDPVQRRLARCLLAAAEERDERQAEHERFAERVAEDTNRLVGELNIARERARVADLEVCGLRQDIRSRVFGHMEALADARITAAREDERAATEADVGHVLDAIADELETRTRDQILDTWNIKALARDIRASRYIRRRRPPTTSNAESPTRDPLAADVEFELALRASDPPSNRENDDYIGAAPSSEPVPTVEEMRSHGWAVGVHNDYRLGGVAHTFWLFTRGSECVSGEGLTDIEALADVARKLRARAASPTTSNAESGEPEVSAPGCKRDPKSGCASCTYLYRPGQPPKWMACEAAAPSSEPVRVDLMRALVDSLHADATPEPGPTDGEFRASLRRSAEVLPPAEPEVVWKDGKAVVGNLTLGHRRDDLSDGPLHLVFVWQGDASSPETLTASTLLGRTQNRDEATAKRLALALAREMQR